MLRSILVPLDGSKGAERALAYATALSVPTAASLVLVRAVAANTLADIDEGLAWAHGLATAQQYLSEVAASLLEQGFASEVATPLGSPASCILSEAELHAVDLITMSTHGRTGPSRWLLGSVAESVVARSPVPVLLERAWQPERCELLLSDRPRLLVPLDGSQFAEKAVGTAARLAEDIAAELILLRVEPVSTEVVHDDYGRVVAYLDQLDERARILAREYLDSVTKHLAEGWPSLSVGMEVRLGEPAAAIDQTVAMTGAALVVMATHGRTGLHRSIMGSVAGQVLERGCAPLLLVRPGVRQAEATAAELATVLV
jgi:nucleotide-binding universal stress UspA family protein